MRTVVVILAEMDESAMERTVRVTSNSPISVYFLVSVFPVARVPSPKTQL